MNSIILITVLLLIIQSTSSLEQPSLKNLRAGITTDYDAVRFDPKSLDFRVHQQHLTGNYVSTGRPYSAFLATFPPYRFSFYPAVADGCKQLVKPSESSSTTYNCEYATNGAFFTWDITSTGSLCIGNLVSDGKVWQLPTDGSGTGRANFGITADHQVLTGFIDANVIASHNFTQLITGWGWLVRNGVNNVNLSQDLSFSPTGFTYEKAPRTSVGVFANGTMALLEIDGEEDILYGPDLFEVAELWLSVGAWSVVNIDGGGSSVSVEEGQIISQPTCNDTPEICERAVANIACVRGK